MEPMPNQGTSVIMVVYCCLDVSGNTRSQNSSGWGTCASPNSCQIILARDRLDTLSTPPAQSKLTFLECISSNPKNGSTLPSKLQDQNMEAPTDSVLTACETEKLWCVSL